VSFEPLYQALYQALPGRLVSDQGDYAEVLDIEGEPLALVGYEPWQVEVELSVILLGEDPEESAHIADERLRAEVVPAWEEAGFQVGEVGELRAGEDVEHPDRVVWSYDLPITVLSSGVEGIAEILEWAETKTREFILWDHETFSATRA
jgi:hypothetical protein